MDSSLFLHLTEQFFHMHGYRPTASESRSWERSIPALMDVLNEAGLGDVEVMLEYALPLNSKRADAVLAGVHPVTGEPSYVVVELKQWSQAEPEEDDPALCRVDSYTHPVLTPVEQVRRYCEYLVNFNGALAAHPGRINGVAYLHNAAESGVAALRELAFDEHGTLFTAERRGALLDHLRTRLSTEHAGASAADELLRGRPVPSRQLMAVAADEVRDREQFVLLDQQQVAYRMVLNAVSRAKRSDHKEVVIVTGGPGTGKSVIALSLLGELFRRGVPALHATGSQSFTKTMRKVAGARRREVQDLFKYFNSFMTAEKNALDVLICDEAHRIRETSANRYTAAVHRTGKRQMEELIDVARVPVFLLDEHQVVRPGEMGTVAEIEAAAAKKGLACRVVPLDSQFRCGGSGAYLRWVVRLLGLEPGGPVVWDPDDRMRLMVADSPREMEAFLEGRFAQGYGARLSAGYCWPWSKEPKPGDPLVADIVIGDWARPWNLRGERSVSGAPPSALWATDPAGFGQVGCVYTAQGFEYDWSGVIIGPDLIWRGDRWITDRASSEDPVFKKAPSGADVDRLIRNTYKVLLTRGMIGTVVYSTDPETRQKLRELVGATRAIVTV
ncbi:ATPase family associated with various cellular activities (AAA) [Streptomyces sp. ADI96-02]|nr:ATPase family associated with various cellular activities (AAA) [Streptomyces sp. ADI96-02]